MNSSKILVTGGQGFLGKTLQRSVKKLSNKNEFKFLSRSEIDLLDINQINELFQDNNFHCVINLASSRISGISGEMNSYKTFIENNTINNNIFHASITSGIKKFINIGSSSIYPPNKIKIKEKAIFTGDPDPGNFFYSLSKLVFTRFLAEIDKDSELNYKSLIVPNLFGPDGEKSLDRAHLINSIFTKIYSFKKGLTKSVEVWGNGEARREFLYAENVADYLTDYAIDNIELLPSIMNIGEDQDFTVKEYYNIVADILSVEPKFVFLLNKPTGADKKLMDSSLSKEFNWSPKIKTIKGIKTLYENEKHLY